MELSFILSRMAPAALTYSSKVNFEVAKVGELSSIAKVVELSSK